MSAELTEVDMDLVFALWDAVGNSDTNKVRELLEEGANPDYWIEHESCLDVAMDKEDTEIIKLLVQYGAELNFENYLWLEGIFTTYYTHSEAKEIMAHFVKYVKDIDVFHHLSQFLITSDLKGPQAMEFLQFLLDNGMPVNEFYPYTNWTDDEDTYTPLHLSIHENRMDFVSKWFHYFIVLKNHQSDGSVN